MKQAYHFFSEEVESLQSSHSLCACLYVSIDNVCLPTHFHPPRNNIEHRPVGGKQHIQCSFKFVLVHSLCQIRHVEST